MGGLNKISRRIKRMIKRYGLATTLVTATTAGVIVKHLLPESNSMKDIPQLTAKKVRNSGMVSAKDGFLMPILVMIEGCTLKAYQDDIGVWTYGIGCTLTKDGARVQPGDVLKDNNEAFDVAKHHINERIDFVFNYISRDLAPEKEAGLSSFAYNCGPGVLVKDKQLTTIGTAVNKGDDKFVVTEMLKYNKAGGSFMRGLFFRRVLEAYVYQDFITMDDLQKCIIGGLGSVSCNKYMQEVFDLKVFKTSKKGKYAATWDPSAITDPNVAKKLIKICQTPINGQISQKLKDFNIGQKVVKFLPEMLLTQNLENQNMSKIASLSEMVKRAKEKVQDS